MEPAVACFGACGNGMTEDWMIRIHLLNKCWSSGNTHIRGYAHLDGRYLSSAGLAQAVDECASRKEFRELLARPNGCFAVAARRGGTVLIATTEFAESHSSMRCDPMNAA